MPVLIPAVLTGAAYVYGRFSDNDTPKGTSASVYTVALYAAAGFGLYTAYRKMKKG